MLHIILFLMFCTELPSSPTRTDLQNKTSKTQVPNYYLNSKDSFMFFDTHSFANLLKEGEKYSIWLLTMLYVYCPFQKESKGILVLFKYVARVSRKINLSEKRMTGCPVGFKSARMTLRFYIQHLRKLVMTCSALSTSACRWQQIIIIQIKRCSLEKKISN